MNRLESLVDSPNTLPMVPIEFHVQYADETSACLPI